VLSGQSYARYVNKISKNGFELKAKPTRAISGNEVTVFNQTRWSCKGRILHTFSRDMLCTLWNGDYRLE